MLSLSLFYKALRQTPFLVVLIAGVLYLPSAFASHSTTCDTLHDTLATTWEAYKARYIQVDGRVRDPNANNISTSESQAYGLLRAVWMNDRPAFDAIWTWTHNNLRLSANKSSSEGAKITNQNHLFAWKWGETAEGKWQVLENNAASDADQDIALALILAGQRWPTDAETFRRLAQPLLADIWAKEVTKTRYFGHVLLPGDWPHSDSQWLLNPSYFSPLWYRVFAEFDSSHNWTSLIDSSYQLVEAVLPTTRTGLPPNWFWLTKGKAKKSQRVGVFTDPSNHQSDYGYDAIRLYWRFGLDYLLTGEKRAQSILHHSNFLERYWQVRHKLPSPLTIDGIERNLDEILYPSNAIYGATLVHLMASTPAIGGAVLDEFILSPLQQGLWQPEKDYYAQNWLWLGLWAYTGQQCDSQQHTGPLAKQLLHWASQ